MSHTIAELRSLSTEELIAQHDQLAQNTFVGTSYYLDELARREAITLSEAIKENTDRVASQVQVLYELTHAAGERMERLTKLIAALTTLSVLTAIVAVVLAA